METTQPIIRFERISKSFGPLVVLKDVDLSIYPGRTTVIIGPSGCGKSVLLKHMVGLIRPDSGKVFFHDNQVNALSERKLTPVRRRIGFLFQGGALFDSMTVEQNICFPLIEHDIGTQQSRQDRCREVLALVGLDGMQRRFPEELSGGQKKRVALARAMAMDPELLLYDEPTTGLDPVRSDLINELILKLQDVLHRTAIVVTHDMNSARKVGDRILMLDGGRFILDTTPECLDKVDDEVVQRFIEGKASREELDELRTGRLSRSADASGGR
ncbi:MAG: ATP-binding cassette domain-containing protein [Planctomycetes bacterium]|nr:ATP-binding cassette domain-containing protein [Planctomycetota bacterium]